MPTDARVFEDFAVGQVFRHPLGRTVTQTDNIWFTLLTVNPNPIHFDEVWAAQTEWKRPLVNSAFTLALVTGLSVGDLSRNAVNLGWDKIRLPHPVFEGDTIYAQSEVLETRGSKSRPHQGIVRFRTLGYNQDGVVVIDYERAILVYRRGHVPPGPQPPQLETG
jgi:acyl dehydratase